MKNCLAFIAAAIITSACGIQSQSNQSTAKDTATPTGRPGACYHEAFKACVESTTIDISSSCTVSGTVFLKKCPNNPRIGTCVVTTPEGTRLTRIYKGAMGFPNAERDCVNETHGRWIPN